jgi:membrane-bound serine protease (ClpP class)
MIVLWLVILVVLLGVLIIWYMVSLGLKALRRPYVCSSEGIIGSRGVAKTDLLPEGKVFAAGTLWTAVSDEGTLLKGTKIVIVSMDGLELTVRAATRH